MLTEDEREYLEAIEALCYIVVHLPAARLLFREIDLVPEAFEQTHDGASGLWKERIVETGDEQ